VAEQPIRVAAVRDRLLWASTAVIPFTFAAVTIVLQRASGVTMFDDEMGFLGEAVFFSSRSGEPLLAGIPFYSTGYPVLLAGPLSVLPFDPWTIAVGLNALLLAAVGPFLYSIVRSSFDVTAGAAAMAAIAGATTPSIVFQAPRAWSEVSMALAFTVWAWCLLRYDRMGPRAGAVPLAVSAGFALAVHRRSSVVVLLTLLLIAGWSLLPALRGSGPLVARLRRVPWRTFVLAEAAGVLTSLGALLLDGYVVDRLYDGTTSGSRLDKARNLLSTDWIPALLGHVWSFLAATFVLAGVGALFLLWSLRARRHLVFSLVLLLAVSGILMTSVLFLANGVRADQLVYERYLAPTAPVLVALGAAALAARIVAARWWLATSGGVLLAGGLLLSVSLEGSRLTGNVQKFTVPTLTSFDVVATGWGQPFTSQLHVLPITAVVLAAACVVALTAWWRPALGPTAVLVAFAVTVAVGSAGNLRPFANLWEPTGREGATVLRDQGVETLQYTPALRHEARNVLHYRLGYPTAILSDPPSCAISEFTVGPPGLEDVHGLDPVALVGNFPGVIYRLDC
jgi:hypothetical protein